MGKRFEEFKMALGRVFENGSDVAADSLVIREAHSNGKTDKTYRWLFVHLLLTIMMVLAIDIVLMLIVFEGVADSTWFRFKEPILILVSFVVCYIPVRGLARLTVRN